jgi:ferric-dicitrate binding protein FerR (iron transport regulator)
MSDDAFDEIGDDPELAELRQLLGGYAHTAPLRPLPPRRRRWPALTGLAAAAAIACWLAWPDAAPPPTLTVRAGDACGWDAQGFAFATHGGPATCGDAASVSGVLPIGKWLETSAEVSARVEVADIGNLTVYGGSRVRLLGTGPDEHRLELARGRIAAQVSAPPRLFVVETPGASAVDLGCAYELAVDDDGRTHLAVTAGAVSLEGHGLVAYVAAGSEVVATPGRGPGIPVAIDAVAPMRAAVARFEAGDDSVLDELLALAEPRDSVTLWNLLGRTHGDAHARVQHRLDALHPSLPADPLDLQVPVHGPQCESIDAPWLE